MKHRKTHYGKKQPKLPCLLFTLDTLRLIQQAIILFETACAQAKESSSNVQFAKETVAQIQRKVAAMIQSEEWERETPFDGNEVLIIHASLQMLAVHLLFSEPSPARELLLKQCMQVSNQFAPLAQVEKHSISK
jgi:hypothetical protein